MKGDIHNLNHNLEIRLKKLKNSSLSDRNKELILEFHNYCFAEGLSISRVLRYIYCLDKVCQWLDKDLDKVEKKDMVSLIQRIERSSYADNTKVLFKVCLKKFYKWRNNGEYPEMVSWFKSHTRNSNHKLPEELLTEDEIKRMIASADHPRDKAFIAMLYESGCRVGEIATLQIKNVYFDKYGAKLIVDGKTGMRRVRIINSVPYLVSWLEIHPFKDNPDSYLWINIGHTKKNEPMQYRGIYNLLRNCAEKASVKKKVNPHAFRHARATHLASYLSDAQMKQYFGWVQGSDMAGIYVHLNGKEVDSALLKMNGLKADEDDYKKEGVLKPVVCPRCSYSNPSTAKFCSRCGLPLDTKTAIEADKKLEMANELMNELVKNPEIQKALVNEIIKKGLGSKLVEIFGGEDE